MSLGLAIILIISAINGAAIHKSLTKPPPDPSTYYRIGIDYTSGATKSICEEYK